MSTWIESHQDLRSNPKTRRAARALETTVPALMGHLHCLWHWALDHAEDGDVSPFDADDLADAAGWEGDADTFVGALTDCGPGEKAGFLEPDGLIGDPDDGKRSPLALHDWWEYAGKLIAKRRKDAERKARARARDIPPPSEEPPEDGPEDVHGTSGGQDGERPRDGAGTEPNRTEPNRTEGQDRAAGASPPAPDDLELRFERWWQGYPRHAKNGKPGGGGARKPASTAFKRLSERKRVLAEQATPNYRAWCESPEGEYPVHASKWLNEERWEQWLEAADVVSQFDPTATTDLDEHGTARGVV